MTGLRSLVTLGALVTFTLAKWISCLIIPRVPPTNPSVGKTKSDNKPPNIEIILDDPENLNYINGRPDPISNESKSPTNPSLGRARSDNKPPDI